MARPKVLSYGGGLDSFAMLLWGITTGEKPDVCVFMDVGDPKHKVPGEWPSTYRHIEEVAKPLCKENGIEFVTLDGNNYPVRDAPSLFEWLWARKQIPMVGTKRICTIVAKVERFERWINDTFPGQEVEVWIGFEAGEESRKENDPNAGTSKKPKPGQAVRRNRFPLMEAGWCRCRCAITVQSMGYPVPSKSACVFCPFGKKRDWRRFRKELPDQFEMVVEMERRKPLTEKNKYKLTIMGWSNREGAKSGTHWNATTKRWYTAPTLEEYLAKPAPKATEATLRKELTCPVCGIYPKATKATGCDYLPPGAAEDQLDEARQDTSEVE